MRTTRAAEQLQHKDSTNSKSNCATSHSHRISTPNSLHLIQEGKSASWCIISWWRELHQSFHFWLKMALASYDPPNPKYTLHCGISCWFISLCCLSASRLGISFCPCYSLFCSSSFCPRRMTGLCKAWLSRSFNSSRLIADPNRPN